MIEPNDVDAAAPAGLAALVPGLAVTLLATLAAAYVSDHYGAIRPASCLWPRI